MGIPAMNVSSVHCMPQQMKSIYYGIQKIRAFEEKQKYKNSYILITCSCGGIFHTVTIKYTFSFSFKSSSSVLSLVFVYASKACTAFLTWKGRETAR